jgi:23S rRNA pseudouridine1911/1915/1917 synthase
MCGEILVINVPEQKIKERLDTFLTRELPKLSRSRIQKLIKDNFVKVNGKEVKSNHIVHPSEKIDVFIPKIPPAEVIPEKISLEIIYEDDYLIVVNKKAGMVVHPAFGHSRGTLVNALLGHGISLSSNTLERPGIVHRLDKDTSGLLVVAKNNYIHQALANQFKEKRVGRVYEAVVWGSFKRKSGTISTQLARNKKDRKKIAVSREGKKAVTHYEVLQIFPLVTHLRLKLETGRTHQIRVHLAYIGHPVFGDQVYGGRGCQLGGLNRERMAFAKALLTSMPRQALHAKTLEFVHPISNKVHCFNSELPEDMSSLILQLTQLRESIWK